MVIDLEQQVIPSLVVSHVSILQCLMAYFRNAPIEKCMSIEIPMHTVVKYEPVRGGGWKESFHRLFEEDDPSSFPVVPELGTTNGGGLSVRHGPFQSHDAMNKMIPVVPSEGEISAVTVDSHPPIWGDSVGSSARFNLSPRSKSKQVV